MLQVLLGQLLTSKFLNYGSKVIGIDNLNSYYDKKLKLSRIKNIERELILLKNWNSFEEISITEQEKLKKVFHENRPKIVINLAAQAGVRYSLKIEGIY